MPAVSLRGTSLGGEAGVGLALPYVAEFPEQHIWAWSRLLRGDVRAESSFFS